MTDRPNPQQTRRIPDWVRNKSVLVVLLFAIAMSASILWTARHDIKRLIVGTPMQQIVQPTVENQMQKYGEAARARLLQIFTARNLTYPPKKVVLLALKDERVLEVYAGEGDKMHYVSTYPILGASGTLGPKLREGDCQVPEGIYQLTLEPNTPYHLALRLNYPNPLDWQHAREDGREAPGSDILIHGKDCSIGCIAMGDPVSEDLFVLEHDAVDERRELIIAPVDLRERERPAPTENDPTWLPTLYDEISAAMRILPCP